MKNPEGRHSFQAGPMTLRLPEPGGPPPVPPLSHLDPEQIALLYDRALITRDEARRALGLVGETEGSVRERGASGREGGEQ